MSEIKNRYTDEIIASGEGSVKGLTFVSLTFARLTFVGLNMVTKKYSNI